LDDLRPYEESHPDGSFEASLIRVARRDFEKAIKVPPKFIAQQVGHGTEAYQVWAKARPANDFKMVQPYLEKTLDYSRQLADYFPGYEHIADPLIDYADDGMKTSSLRRIFSELSEKLITMVKAITSQEPADDSGLKEFREQQMSFSKSVVERLGYDFNRGRLDTTHHPL
jgi:carboxypeptidase Taq